MESGVREEDGALGGGSPAVALAMDGQAAAGEQERGGNRDRSFDPHVIRWERFLPRRSLRILLVEHDDSTRHIVTALLRKCSYRVAAVSDGLKAWEVLKERHCNIDLVLTEVTMPSISGIGLLCKMMGTEECKNIPVIMMSSHDSIGVVLKCMLKGAVDFLVKPVRKNELRNLWQHVWRKHCSSSYANASDNNAASNHISANADDGSKTGENSDDGTDAQSSGSKPEMEIESVQKTMEPQLVEGRSFSPEVEGKLEVVKLASASVDNVGETRDKPEENGVEVTLPLQKNPAAEKSQEGLIVDPKSYSPNNALNEPMRDTIDFMEPIANGQCRSFVSDKDVHKEDDHFQNTSNFGMLPSWELSLRRPQLNGCVPREKERHILNHSNSSAFSRYCDNRINTSSHKTVPSASCIRTIECINICNSHLSSHGTEKEKHTPLNSIERISYPQAQSNAGEATTYLQAPSENNKEDVSHSSTREHTVLRCPLYGFLPLSIPFGAAPYQSLCSSYAIRRPLFYPENSSSPHCSAAVEMATIQPPSAHTAHHDNHNINHPQSIEFRHHDENHQSRNLRQLTDSEPRNTRVFSCNPMEQVYQNSSCTQDFLKVSGSNGSGETADAAANTETALQSGNDSGIQNCNRGALDCDRSLREAALIKFRLKRKERCFEKKVRYHSRKKLAEQRPRVKGQFVRQIACDAMEETEAGCL